MSFARAFVFLACLTIPLRVTADPFADDINQILADGDGSGVGLSVVTRDAVLLETGIGVAERATSRPVAGDTIFPVASVSKVFLAIGLLNLIEERGVSLDTPLAAVAPELDVPHRWQDSKPIRLVHLLEHTTGLQEIVAGWQHGGDDPYVPVADLFDKARPHLEVQLPPGTAATYSNINYLLVAAVIEKLAGEPFDAYLKRTLFVPLGMPDTTFRLKDVDQSRLARGYKGTGRDPVEPVENFYRPAAGLISTPRDLTRFLRALLNDGVLDGQKIASEATLTTIERPVSSLAAAHGLTIGHAPGLTVRQIDGRILYGHVGIMDAYTGALFFSRELGIGFAAMLNAHPLPRAPSLGKVRDAVLKHHFADLPRVPPRETTYERAAVKDLTGFYAFQNPRFALLEPAQALLEHAWVYEKDGDLFRWTLLEGAQKLLPAAGATAPAMAFRASGEPVARLVFARDDDGRQFFYEVPNSYYQTAVVWPKLLDVTLLVASLVILPAYALWLVWKLRDPLKNVERWLVWGMMATLIVLGYCLTTLDTTRPATSFNAPTATVFVATIAFPVLAAALALRRGLGVVSASALILALYFIRCEVVGLRPWDFG